MNMHQGPTRKYLTIQQLYRGLDNYLAAEQRDAFDASASLERLTNLMADAIEGERSLDVNDSDELVTPHGESLRIAGQKPVRMSGDRPVEDPAESRVRRLRSHGAIVSNKPRWFLRNWSIRSKVLVVALLPAVTVLVFGGVQVNGLVVSGLLTALICALFVARSLTKPLRVLRSNALDVAYSRLPQTVRRILADPDPVAASKNAVEPVPVFTREETGQLARSFDALQEQAVQLVTDQAMLRENYNSLFVNLSRRSHGLVQRQLVLLDRLERDEQDPDQLAMLFELDHLATRARRNAENLLVLSGTGLSRQLSRPAPALDVVRAAVSEIEHYTRVQLRPVPDVAVQGRAVSDLVHVIAELLDNATFFSPADKKVIVRMAMTRKKELAIQITDQGVGMSEEEIAATNARLADPPDLDVAVTRRMGLYVVARLAKRHNITVRLRDNEDIEGGLIAQVIVPAELIEPPALMQEMDITTGYQPPAPAEPSGGLAHTTPPAPGWEDAPTERLPIYEAVLSQWFEAVDTGRGKQPGETSTVVAEPAEEETKYPAPWLSSRQENSQADQVLPKSTEQVALFGAPLPEPAYETGLAPVSASPAPADVVEPTPWTSPGDDGWLAARALLAEQPADTTTTAGLPKRVPKARLVPGSTTPQHEAKKPTDEPAQLPLPPRAADAVRDRMSSFQQGVRRGRHALSEAYAEAISDKDESRQDNEHE